MKKRISDHTSVSLIDGDGPEDDGLTINDVINFIFDGEKFIDGRKPFIAETPHGTYTFKFKAIIANTMDGSVKIKLEEITT